MIDHEGMCFQFGPDENGLWASMFFNQVWTFGCNDEGSLGRPIEEEEDSFLPGEVNYHLLSLQYFLLN